MDHVATIHCEGIPQVAIYGDGTYDILPSVRLYADAGRYVLALQRDVPITPKVSRDFAACVSE